MKALKRFLTIVRPVQCLTAAAAVVVVARIALGQFVFNTPALAAAGAMALLVFGSSVYHCAFQNHNHPYTRRVNDYIREQHPYLWGMLAFLAFQGSVYLTVKYLPIGCTIATILAGGLVILYTARRGVNGPLNSLVGLICTVPVFVGWASTGVPFAGVTVFLLGTTFWLYFLREEIKDHQEKPRIALRSWLDCGPRNNYIVGGFVCTAAMLMYPILYFHMNGHLLPRMSYNVFVGLAFAHYFIFSMIGGIARYRRAYPQGIMTALVWLYMTAGVIH